MTDEQLKQIVGLITAMLDETPGARYTCGHYTGEVRLIGDVTPSIVIWGHTQLDSLSPRVLDMESAKEFRSLARHELDSIGIAGVERYAGDRADYIVGLYDHD